MNPLCIKKTGIGIISALFLLNSLTASNDLPGVTNPSSVSETTPRTPISTQAPQITAGTTIIDSRDHPNDLSDIARQITIKIKQALESKKKVILILGEIHGIPTHIRLAETVRNALHEQTKIEKPIMAQEANYRFLESSLSDFFPEKNNDDLRKRAMQALSTIKEKNKGDYNRLQAMALASANWDFAPITRLETLSSWIDQGLDVRLVDIAKTADGFININDPATSDFVDAHTSPNIISKAYIQTSGDPQGIHLRNLWMAKNLLSIVKEESSPVVILQIGLNHVAGNKILGFPYKESLHHALSNAASENVKIITVLPETRSISFNTLASEHARQALNNADTMIVRGLNPVGHWPSKGSSKEEIETLIKIFHDSGKKGTPPKINQEDEFYTLKAKVRNNFEKELQTITNRYAPAP